MDANSETIWDELQRHMMCVLPKSVKKILEYQGYDNLVCLSKLKPETVAEVESFVRESFSDLIEDKKALLECIAPFKDRQRFRFLPGHVLLFEPLGKAAEDILRLKSQPIGYSKDGPKRKCEEQNDFHWLGER